MSSIATESKPAAGKSAGIGITIGTGVLLLYLAAGVLFESWNVGAFLSNLTLERAGTFLLLSGMAIAIFAIPVALFLYSRIITPITILGVIIVGWLGIGISSGIIKSGAIFGLAYYALGLSPLYVILYLLFGGGEYYARKQGVL